MISVSLRISLDMAFLDEPASAFDGDWLPGVYRNEFGHELVIEGQRPVPGPMAGSVRGGMEENLSGLGDCPGPDCALDVLEVSVYLSGYLLRHFFQVIGEAAEQRLGQVLV